MPTQWLAEHLHRLNLAHEKAGKHLQKAAAKRKTEKGHNTASFYLKIRDIVITKHYRACSKIQDFWGERRYKVMKVPGSDGGPIVVSPCDGIGGPKRVT